MPLLIRAIREAIESRQRNPGGWSYAAHQDAIEPTCLAILSCRNQPGDYLGRAVDFIERAQNPDGGWAAFTGDDQPSCWATALAVLSLIAVRPASKRLDRGIRWLVRNHGREGDLLWQLKFRLVDRDVQFDPAKYGWNWIGGTTSWVIPTAFSLMALRRAKRRLSGGPDFTLRIHLGTAMLLDRMCPGGGWNAGNGVAFGVPYSPYIDATSIALLALRGHEDQPGVLQSLFWLSRRIRGCPAPYSLAWGLVALAAYRDVNLRIKEVLAQTNQTLLAMVAERIDILDIATLAISMLAIEALQGENAFEIAT
jgi:hypothetical protein